MESTYELVKDIPTVALIPVVRPGYPDLPLGRLPCILLIMFPFFFFFSFLFFLFLFLVGGGLVSQRGFLLLATKRLIIDIDNS